MKIAIKFGDNDFYNTFKGVLETLNGAYKWTDRLPVKKAELCKMINEISYGCYLLYQNQFSYNDEKQGEVCERTKRYLQITPEKILIDKEVDEYLATVEWDNSETFILDTDLNFPNNNPIYTR